MENILEKMYQSALKFLVRQTVEETYTTIISEAGQLIGAEFGTILLAKDRVLYNVFSTAPPRYQAKFSPRRRGYAYHVFWTGKPSILTAEMSKKIHPGYNTEIKSVIMIPLSYGEESVGVLVMQSTKKQSFSKADLHVLKLFGSMASLAIRKTLLYGEVEKALEIRDSFISMAAHELRTPLTTVSGYIQLLQQRLIRNNLSGNHITRLMEELAVEMARLTHLVNEILVVNRIKVGELRYKRKKCQLREIIKKAILGFQFRFPTRKVVITDKLKDSEDWIMGDFDKLLQAILNLLDNAAKFSASNSKIRINLVFKPPDFNLVITDSGRGIPKDALNEIFSWYHKGPNSVKEGMGVGLPLSKNIIQDHGGSINIRSKIGRGTRVEVFLPSIIP